MQKFQTLAEIITEEEAAARAKFHEEKDSPEEAARVERVRAKAKEEFDEIVFDESDDEEDESDDEEDDDEEEG
jgi:hypothetical protein